MKQNKNILDSHTQAKNIRILFLIPTSSLDKNELRISIHSAWFGSNPFGAESY
jgi:hypothetical protein